MDTLVLAAKASAAEPKSSEPLGAPVGGRAVALAAAPRLGGPRALRGRDDAVVLPAAPPAVVDLPRRLQVC